jgi:hypothetical protein
MASMISVGQVIIARTLLLDLNKMLATGIHEDVLIMANM